MGRLAYAEAPKMVRTADAPMHREGHSRSMTVSERIENQSFAYDAQFPPDVAEGLPLRAAVPRRPAPQQMRVRRALMVCVRVVSRRR